MYEAIAVAIARGSAEPQMRAGKPWISPRPPLQGAGAVAIEQRVERQQLAAPVVA